MRRLSSTPHLHLARRLRDAEVLHLEARLAHAYAERAGDFAAIAGCRWCVCGRVLLPVELDELELCPVCHPDRPQTRGSRSASCN